MLNLKLQDKVPCSEILKRTKIMDIIEYTLKHTAQTGNQGLERDQGDDQIEDGKRHSKERGNHLEQERNRKKTMKVIDGGLHPAVDGQSLGER